MVLKTKFGSAKITAEGYYQIKSRKEGNNGKMLHRLIYEDYYKVSLLNTTHIHHIDGNKINNQISNLKAIFYKDHISLHKKGNNHLLGTHRSEETKQKISDAHKGKSKTLEHRLNLSKARGNTGYYRVRKCVNAKYKQGFFWQYRYLENGKSKAISSIDIDRLRKKVISKGLEWRKHTLNENIVMEGA